MINNKQKKSLKKQKSNLETPTFTNLSPRRGSLPIRSPKLLSPTTPNTPERRNPLLFSPQLENFEEVGETLDNLLTKGKGSSEKILNRLLEEKEREIQRLETEKTQLLKEKQEFEQQQAQQASRLAVYTQKIAQLETEVKESNDDYYQLGLEKDKLTSLLSQEKLNNLKLEQQLAQEVGENYHLRENQEKVNANLLQKVEELTKVKKLNQQEREE
jgi:hypothetical protein